MKSVGEIGSKICLIIYSLLINLTFTFGQGHRHFGHCMRLIELTLVPSIKFVGEIVSEI